MLCAFEGRLRLGFLFYDGKTALSLGVNINICTYNNKKWIAFLLVSDVRYYNYLLIITYLVVVVSSLPRTFLMRSNGEDVAGSGGDFFLKIFKIVADLVPSFYPINGSFPEMIWIIFLSRSGFDRVQRLSAAWKYFRSFFFKWIVV